MRILTLTPDILYLSLSFAPLTAEALHFPLLSQFVRLWYITKVAFDPFGK